MQRVIFKECIIKVWNVMFSLSLGSVSTLIRWGGHFCHVCTTFLSVYNSAKNIKIHQDCPELWSQMFFHLFMVHSVHLTVLSSRAFRHSATAIWNNLHADIRGTNATWFKCGLKTHLFIQLLLKPNSSHCDHFSLRVYNTYLALHMSLFYFILYCIVLYMEIAAKLQFT